MWLRSRRVPIWQQRRFPPSLKPPLKFVGKQVDAHPTWSFVIVSALALILYALFSTQRVILIENIAVPKAIEELGFSSTALTSQVRSAIIHIDSEVPESRGGKARSSFRGNDEKESPDFEIPGTKIGYRQAIQFLREEFGNPPTRISAELFRTGKTFRALVRVTEANHAPIEETISITPDDKLASAIAEKVLSVLKPAKLATYLYFNRYDRAGAFDLLVKCIGEINNKFVPGAITPQDPARKAECLVARADIESTESDYAAAERDDRRALLWDKNSVQAMSGLAMLKSTQGETKSTLDMLQEAIALDSNALTPHDDLAWQALQEGDLVLARSEADRAVRISGRDSGELSLLASVLNLSGERDRAIDLVVEALTTYPKSTAALDTWGAMLMDAGRYSEAEEKWKEALNIDPKDADIVADWALALCNHNWNTECAAKYREALKLRPNSVWFHDSLARVLVQLGRFDEADEEFAQALRIRPDSVVVLNDWARNLMNEDRPLEADTKWAQALSVSPNNPSIYTARGDAFGDLNDYPQAESNYRMSLKLDPTNIYARRSFAIALQAIGKSAEAYEQFREAIRHSPGNIWVLADWGRALASNGWMEDAEAKWKAALNTNPQSEYVYSQWGSALSEQGNIRGAGENFTKAVHLNDRDPWLRRQLANSYAAQRMWRDADIQYQAALSSNPTNVFVLADWGYFLGVDGRMAEAEAKWKAALQVKYHARRDYVYNQWASALSDRNNFGEAIEKYRLAVAARPRDSALQTHLAETYVSQNEWEAANARFQQALAFNPGNVDLFAAWGHALSYKGNLLPAEAMWKKGLELNPHSNAVLSQWADGLPFEQAVDKNRTALKFNPRCWWLLSRLANAYAIQANLDAGDAKSDATHGNPTGANNHRHAAQSKWATAFGYFQEALESNPGNITVLSDWGHALAEEGEGYKAEAAWNMARKLAPESDISLTREGNFFDEQDEVEKAIDAYEHAAALNPKDELLLPRLANVYVRAKQWENANEVFARVYQLRPKDVNLLTDWAQALANSGRIDKAGEQWATAIRIDPGNADLYTQWADALSDADELQKAIGLYQAGLQQDRKSSTISLKLAKAYGRRKQWSDAYRWFEQASKLDPTNLNVLADWARSLAAGGRMSEAIAKWNSVLKLNTKNSYVYIQWGDALRYDRSDLTGAISRYKRAASLAPQSPSSVLRLATAYAAAAWQAKDSEAQALWRQTFETFDRAAKLDPRDATVLADWGRALSQSGQLAEAEKKWNEALKLNSANDYVYSQWGDALQYDQGDSNSAIEKFKLAIEANPEPYWYRTRLANAFVAIKDWETAYKVFTQVSSAYPENPYILGDWAHALATGGNLSQANTKWNQAVLYAPQDESLYIEWGNALMDAGKYAEASIKYSRALQLVPDSEEAQRRLGEARKLE